MPVEVNVLRNIYSSGIISKTGALLLLIPL
jgi:hypothetical protein